MSLSREELLENTIRDLVEIIKRALKHYMSDDEYYSDPIETRMFLELRKYKKILKNAGININNDKL